ncbi:MAG: hypothetical protein HY243_01430, partial [Proteobacteria bacterium]|nr:hypothetical protein [Pseudomonadota bacterium]
MIRSQPYEVGWQLRNFLLGICASIALGSVALGQTNSSLSTQVIDHQIASTGVAEEAESFIPEIWHHRIRPLRTVRLDASCVDLREINGTPRSAAEQAFVFQCGSVPWNAMGGAQVLGWVSAKTLKETTATTLPDVFWRGDFAIRDDKAFASFESTFDIKLLSSSGKFLTVPELPSIKSSWSRDLAPSGRFMLRMNMSEFIVLDVQTITAAFRTAATAAYYLVRETAGGTLQLVGSGREPECDADTCVPEVFVLDARTKQVHHIPIPNGVGFVVPRSYGDRQVLVDVRSTVRTFDYPQFRPADAP